MTSTQLSGSIPKPSVIALGCEPLGGADWGKVNIHEARGAVRCALDLGITTFDTADVYGLGRSEVELSYALDTQRHNAFIITKFGVHWNSKKTGGRAQTYKNASPNHLKSAIEDSLRRLRVETISLYLVHWPDTNTPLESTLEALERTREQGKILNYGLSNFSIDAICKASRDFAVWAVENPYSLIQHEQSEEVFKTAKQLGISTFAYGALAQGFLTNKYDQSTQFTKNDRRIRLPQFTKENWKKWESLMAALCKIANNYNKLPAQVAIRWVLVSGYVDTVVIGAKSPNQVKMNMGSLGWSLLQDEKVILEQTADAETNGLNFKSN